MKKLVLLAVSALTVSLCAQITVGKSQMPAMNDTIRYSQSSIINVQTNISKKGSNSWDFSSLSPVSQDIYSYKNSLQTPYAFYFFNKVGLKTADSFGAGPIMLKNIYSFYNSSNTDFKALGLGYSFSGIPLAANYIDEDVIYKFPLTYGDSTTDDFNFLFSLPSGNLFSLRQKGSRTNIVDAYGSITTPYKTYPNTIRVKTIINEIDSLKTQFGAIPFPRNQVIYKWLSLDEKIPVLEITGNVTAGVFIATQIRYRDQYSKTASSNLIRSNFTVNKTLGRSNTDTFTFTTTTTPLAGQSNWQFTPSTFNFVNGTSASNANPQVVFTANGKYTVKLTSTVLTITDDTTATDLISITPTGSVYHNIFSTQITPNPSQGSFTISQGDLRLVTNLQGQHVAFQGSQNSYQIMAQAGIYTLHILDKWGYTHIYRLLLN